MPAARGVVLEIVAGPETLKGTFKGTPVGILFLRVLGLKCHTNVHVVGPQYIHGFRNHKWSFIGLH
jgi:hypothetical protein